MNKLEIIKNFILKYKLQIIIVIILFIFSVFFVHNFFVYQKADMNQKKYEEMLTDVYKAEATVNKVSEIETAVEITAAIDENNENHSDVTDSETLGEYNKRKRGIEEAKKDGNLRERIDFSELETLIGNSEYHSWLYIPDTVIDYVVMKGSEEEPLKYLWKDPYGKKSNTGSLFVNNTGDEDDHTIIYGHRLKNHDLYFGALLNFKDEEYAKAHQVAYVYESDKVTRYKLYSVNEGLETDSIYYYPYVKSTSDYLYLLQDITDKANFTVQESFDDVSRMLVLSTCSGNSGGQPQRLYLVYEEDVVYEY